MAAGAPTKFKPEYITQAKKLAWLGATDDFLADFFNVTKQTINNWKKSNPEFFDSLKKGKQVADTAVVKALFRRATGYAHKEDKIFQYEGCPIVVPTVKHYPPDTLACIYWIKNRLKDEWKDRVDQDNGNRDDIHSQIAMLMESNQA